MNDLLEGLRSSLGLHPARRFWIGYSGGLDSQVLLHLCARFRADNGGDFVAVHVNHGLHPEADKWQDHCRRSCEDLTIPFEAVSVDARPQPGESPEEASRNARYQAFSRCLNSDEALLLAHHQDDQAETVLLQLLRGAGVAGLAGMGQAAGLGRGKLLRPLLGVSRQALHEYALKHRLDWIDDPSNQILDFDRNYLRHHLFPLLKQRWPGCARTLSRSAGHFAETDRLLNEWGRPLLLTMTDEEGALDIAALGQQSRPSQRWLLRAWLKDQRQRAPAAVLLDRILDEVIWSRGDRNPRVAWGDAEVRRYRGRLFVLPQRPLPEPGWRMSWNGVAPLRLPDGSMLEAGKASGQGIDGEKWRTNEIEVRYRQGGERCRLAGRHGHRSLKKMFQERGIPPWVRERLPLVYMNGELAAVGDLWVCAPFCAASAGPGVKLRWSGVLSLRYCDRIALACKARDRLLCKS